MAEDDAPDRSGNVASRKRREGRHQRHERRATRKDRVGNVTSEDAEDYEVVELEGTAEAGEQDNAPAAGRNAIARGRSRIRDRVKHAVNLVLKGQHDVNVASQMQCESA